MIRALIFLVLAAPAGAEVLWQDGAPDACAGEVILSEDMPLTAATRTHADRLAGEGFMLTDLSDASVSFFVGQRPGCAVALYLERDADTDGRSTVIVRYLEE